MENNELENIREISYCLVYVIIYILNISES